MMLLKISRGGGKREGHRKMNREKIEKIEEKWKDWNSKADTLLNELRTCRDYKEIEEEMKERIEEIFDEYTALLKEGLKFLPVEGKIKRALKIVKAKWNYRAYRFKWLLLKFGRLMIGLDI